MIRFNYFMIFINVGMVDRIQCPHCQLGLAGEGHLHRHIKAVHKSELKVTVKN